MTLAWAKFTVLWQSLECKQELCCWHMTVLLSYFKRHSQSHLFVCVCMPELDMWISRLLCTVALTCQLALHAHPH